MRSKLSGCTVFILLFIFLVGCTHSGMRDGVKAMKGKDFKYIASLLGPPNDLVEHQDGEKTVAWSNVENLTLTVPKTINSYGYYGGQDFTVSTTTNTTEHYKYNCTITARISNDGKIINSSYRGDLGGCSEYRSRLSRLIDSFRANHIDNVGPSPSEVPLVDCKYMENGKIKNLRTSDRGCDQLSGKIVEIIELAE